MNKATRASSVLAALLFVFLHGCAEISVAARLVDVSVVTRSSGELPIRAADVARRPA